MWKTEVTKRSNVAKEQIWSAWADVDNWNIWNIWDKEVENSSLSGAFEVGTFGQLKAKNGPKSKFKIIESTRNKSFTNRAKLPFCTLDFIHEIKECDDSILVTHRIEIKGALSFFFSRIIGKQQAKSLPYAVEALIKLTEDEK